MLSSRLVARRPVQFVRIADIAPALSSTSSNFYGTAKDPCSLATDLISVYDALQSNAEPRPSALDCAAKVVLALDRLGWTTLDIDAITFSFAMPLREVLRMCQANPPDDWPLGAYELVGRPDIAHQLGSRRHRRMKRHRQVSRRSSSFKLIG